jgi:hypothetical protein
MCQLRWILSLRGNDGKIVRCVTSVSIKDLVTNNFPFWGRLANILPRYTSLMWPATRRSGCLAGCSPDHPKRGSY